MRAQCKDSPKGFPYWENEKGVVALCQFRDNILIGSSYQDDAEARVMDTVCRILESSWDHFGVFMAPGSTVQLPTTATGRMQIHLPPVHMSSSGLLVRGAEGHGTVFIQPSALTSTWQLKPPPHHHTLQGTPCLPPWHYPGCPE